MAYEALCHLDKEEIIKRFISVEFNHFLEYYRHAGDINAKPRKNNNNDSRRGPRKDGRRRERNENPDVKRFSINMGRKHKINAGAIVRLICENSNIKSNQIGEISLGQDQSFLDVKKEAVSAVQSGMKNVQLDGRKVSLGSAGSGDYSSGGGRSGGGRSGGGRSGGGRQGGRPNNRRR